MRRVTFDTLRLDQATLEKIDNPVLKELRGKKWIVKRDSDTRPGLGRRTLRMIPETNETPIASTSLYKDLNRKSAKINGIFATASEMDLSGANASEAAAVEHQFKKWITAQLHIDFNKIRAAYNQGLFTTILNILNNSLTSNKGNGKFQRTFSVGGVLNLHVRDDILYCDAEIAEIMISISSGDGDGVFTRLVHVPGIIKANYKFTEAGFELQYLHPSNTALLSFCTQNADIDVDAAMKLAEVAVVEEHQFSFSRDPQQVLFLAGLQNLLRNLKEKQKVSKDGVLKLLIETFEKEINLNGVALIFYQKARQNKLTASNAEAQSQQKDAQSILAEFVGTPLGLTNPDYSLRKWVVEKKLVDDKEFQSMFQNSFDQAVKEYFPAAEINNSKLHEQLCRLVDEHDLLQEKNHPSVVCQRRILGDQIASMRAELRARNFDPIQLLFKAFKANVDVVLNNISIKSNSCVGKLKAVYVDQANFIKEFLSAIEKKILFGLTYTEFSLMVNEFKEKILNCDLLYFNPETAEKDDIQKIKKQIRYSFLRELVEICEKFEGNLRCDDKQLDGAETERQVVPKFLIDVAPLYKQDSQWLFQGEPFDEQKDETDSFHGRVYSESFVETQIANFLNQIQKRFPCFSLASAKATLNKCFTANGDQLWEHVVPVTYKTKEGSILTGELRIFILGTDDLSVRLQTARFEFPQDRYNPEIQASIGEFLYADECIETISHAVFMRHRDIDELCTSCDLNVLQKQIKEDNGFFSRIIKNIASESNFDQVISLVHRLDSTPHADGWSLGISSASPFRSRLIMEFEKDNLALLKPWLEKFVNGQLKGEGIKINLTAILNDVCMRRNLDGAVIDETLLKFLQRETLASLFTYNLEMRKLLLSNVIECARLPSLSNGFLQDLDSNSLAKLFRYSEANRDVILNDASLCNKMLLVENNGSQIDRDLLFCSPAFVNALRFNDESRRTPPILRESVVTLLGSKSTEDLGIYEQDALKDAQQPTSELAQRSMAAPDYVMFGNFPLFGGKGGKNDILEINLQHIKSDEIATETRNLF